MSGGRLTALLRRENDAGVRFTPGRSGDSHVARRPTTGAAASCASGYMPCGAARAAPSVAVATPQSEGLVRVRTQVCFHTPAPVPWGRSRSINPYAGRRFERRFEAADHPFADRPAVWQPGITEQGRGTPDAVPGIERGGSLRSRPQAPARHRRSRDRAATTRRPATCGSAGVHIAPASPCTCTSMSMCTRGTPPAAPIRGPGTASRDRSRAPLRKNSSNRNYKLASRDATGAGGQGL